MGRGGIKDEWNKLLGITDSPREIIACGAYLLLGRDTKRASAVALVLILISALALGSNSRPALASSLTLEIEVEKTHMLIGEEISITLTLTNIGETNWQTTYGPPLFDLAYSTPDGSIFWSTGKLFIQVILDLLLEPGESVTQTLEWDFYPYRNGAFYLPRPGTYQLAGLCSYAGICNTTEITLSAWNSAAVNYDWKVDIQDAVLIAGAYGSTPSDSNWDPYCDVAEPLEIINIFDLVTITASYGEEYAP